MKKILKIIRYIISGLLFILVAVSIYGMFTDSLFSYDIELNGILMSIIAAALGIGVILIYPKEKHVLKRIRAIIGIICAALSIIYFVRAFWLSSFDVSAFVTGCVVLAIGLLNLRLYFGMKISQNRSIFLIIVTFILIGMEISLGELGLNEHRFFLVLVVVTVLVVILILFNQKRRIIFIRDGNYDLLISKFNKKSSLSKQYLVAFCQLLKGNLEETDEILMKIEVKFNKQGIRKISYLSMKIANDYLMGKRNLEEFKSLAIDLEKTNKKIMKNPLPLGNIKLILAIIESDIEHKKFYLEAYYSEKEYAKTYKWSKLQKELIDLIKQEESFYLGEYYFSIGDMEKANLEYKKALEYPFDNIYKNISEVKLLSII